MAQPPREWTYVALGDSLAFGASAREGYVARYRMFIASDTGATVRLVNLGVPGWTSEDLLRALRNDQNMRTAISTAQVVTWDIGGNDLLGSWNAFREGRCGGTDGLACFRGSVTTFKQNWNAILAEILALRNRQNTILRTMDIYNPFVGLQKATGTFEVLKPFLDDVNAYLTSSAAQNGVPVARVYAAMNGASGDEDAGAKGYISQDLLHPNDAGHIVIAEALRQLGYAPLHP